jgi:hypothetical protein
MPERWERELGKLGTLTAPPSVPPRIGEGPHGEGGPTAHGRRQRVVAAVVAFSVFGAAAILAVAAFRKDDADAPIAPDATSNVVIHVSSEGGPKASLEFADQVADPQVGSHCWAAGGVEGCIDTYLSAFPSKDFVDVPPGTPIVIDASGDPADVTTALASGDNPQDLIEQTRPVSPVSVIDGESGLPYVLTVTANWPQGSVEFFFPIEIASTESPPASPGAQVVATLDLRADGSIPRLTLASDDHEAGFDAQDGHWPGLSLSPIRTQTFDPAIEPGATLVIDSDASKVEGSVRISDADQNLTGQSIPLHISSGSATLPTEPGFYQLTLVGTWPEGEAGFSVGITIGSPPADWPPPPGTAVVPDVMGLDKHEAIQRVMDAGFGLVSVATAADQPTGVVTSQDPPPGTRTETTTTINLTVSVSS